MSKIEFTYWSAKREHVLFGDALTPPVYKLDRVQSEYVRNYSTDRGRNNHVAQFVNDIKRHRILSDTVNEYGTRTIVVEDALGYLALTIRER